MLIQTISLVIVATGTIIAIIQLFFLHKQNRSQHDWNRRVTSLRFTFIDDPQIREIRERLDRHLKIRNRVIREISIEEIKTVENEYPQIRIDLPTLLGRLETMCIAIRNGLVDEQICKDMNKVILQNYYRLFIQYIEESRSSLSQSTLYENLEHFAKRWSEKALKGRQNTG